jgi:mannitol/fructose-specific phosphotransferase system IIA component (Ntr-type)
MQTSAQNGALRLSEILRPEYIKAPLVAMDKAAAVEELVELLAGHPAVSDVTAVRRAIWEREQVRTTGIGNGLALPHGKTAGVSDLVIALGKPAQPIDFDSVDRKGVSVIVLLASPLDKTGPHIRALAWISRLLTIESFRTALEAARDGRSIMDAIEQHERSLA